MTKYPLVDQSLDYLNIALDYTPVGWARSKLENVFGNLDLSDKLRVDAIYTVGTGMAGWGVYNLLTTGEIHHIIPIGIGLLIDEQGLEYQFKKSRKMNNRLRPRLLCR